MRPVLCLTIDAPGLVLLAVLCGFVAGAGWLWHLTHPPPRLRPLAAPQTARIPYHRRRRRRRA